MTIHDYLAAKQAILEKASAGPWLQELDDGYGRRRIYHTYDCAFTGNRNVAGFISFHVKRHDAEEFYKDDATFIADSRNHRGSELAALKIAVEALEKIGCNETFHRLGGIDDCQRCEALRAIIMTVVGEK